VAKPRRTTARHRRRATGALLGNLHVTVEDGVATLSYWLAADARGQGYLQHALDTVLAWLASTSVTTVRLDVHPGNAVSIRAAERGGFVSVGEKASEAPYADGGVVVTYERLVV
jgi:RimJ/RimL family protein N-acetyltransferase